MVSVEGRCLYCGPIVIEGKTVNDATARHVLSEIHQNLMRLDRQLEEGHEFDPTDRTSGARCRVCDGPCTASWHFLP